MERYYEDIYKNKNNFSFGKNWQDYILSLNDHRIKEAKSSLVDFLGNVDSLKGKTFVDIGCGSGLFSLGAYLLGAKEVVSVDIDDFSIACTKELKKRQGNADNWKIIKGSALDKNFIDSLGKFDVVYSWGVLHHSGDMFKAFSNVSDLLAPNGLFYLAIYNKSRSWWIGTSNFWLKVKKLYNNSGAIIKKTLFFMYVVYFFIDSLISLRNPFKRIKKSNRRGMNWYHNVIDWLGGYPYEFASPEEIINYFSTRNIYCAKIKNGYGLGCAEYLLQRSNIKL